MVVRHRLGQNRGRGTTGLPGDLLSQRHGHRRGQPQRLRAETADHRPCRPVRPEAGQAAARREKRARGLWPGLCQGGRHGRETGRLAHAAPGRRHLPGQPGGARLSPAADARAHAARAAAGRERLFAQGRAARASELLLQQAAARYPWHHRALGRQAGSRDRHHLARSRVVQPGARRRCQRLELDRRQPRRRRRPDGLPDPQQDRC